MKKEFSTIPIRLKHEAEVHILVNPKKVFVLLHGYLLDGSFMYEKLLNFLPKESAIIAPNGPFMVPVKKQKGYFPRFAWYFFDPTKKTYYIDYIPAAEYIKSLLIEMELIRKPITVIGYSQGGYLAPKLAEMIPSVESVIGLACCFRNDYFKFRHDVLYHQINSTSDLVVDYEGAKQEFVTLRERGNLGRFVTLNDIGHKLDENYAQELKLML